MQITGFPSSRSKAYACVRAALVLLLSGCAPFSEFQSARMAGVGRVEVTPTYSRVGSTEGFFQDQLGVQVGVGVHELVDLRMRYENLWYDGNDGSSVKVLGFGPKIRLRKNTDALYLPIGLAFGDNLESSQTWEAHPTLLGTHVMSAWSEMNSSLKLMVPLNAEETHLRFAINFGAGLGPADLSWMFRPEFGMMFNTQGGSPTFHFGIGLSVASTVQKRSKQISEP